MGVREGGGISVVRRELLYVVQVTASSWRHVGGKCIPRWVVMCYALLGENNAAAAYRVCVVRAFAVRCTWSRMHAGSGRLLQLPDTPNLPSLLVATDSFHLTPASPPPCSPNNSKHSYKRTKQERGHLSAVGAPTCRPAVSSPSSRCRSSSVRGAAAVEEAEPPAPAAAAAASACASTAAAGTSMPASATCGCACGCGRETACRLFDRP